MDLFIAAQDIGSITLGLVDGASIVCEETHAVSPEAYLQTLNAFLEKNSVETSSIHRLLVVPGPGSFTASRVSVTIANTIAFVWNIPVVSLPNPQKLSLNDLIAQRSIKKEDEHPFTAPVYDRPPNITESKKHQ